MFLVALSLCYAFLRYYYQQRLTKLDMRPRPLLLRSPLEDRALTVSSGTDLLCSSISAIQKAVDAMEAAVAARRLKQRATQHIPTERERRAITVLKDAVKETLEETLPLARCLLENLDCELGEEMQHQLDAIEVSDVVEEPAPLFRDYQLLGDSLLLRFAEQILGENCVYGGGLRRIGLCVSGQTTHQLLIRTAERFAPLGSKGILLIGTNDLLQGVPIEDMKSSLQSLLNVLTRTMDRIVLLTLPPIPKLETEKGFWFKHTEYNHFLHDVGNRMSKVCVVDIAPLFLESSFRSDMKYFEKWYDEHHNRPDRIHLNKTGLLTLRNHLINCQELY